MTLAPESTNLNMSKEALSLLGQLFNSSSEGIIFFDKEGKIIMMNPRSLSMFGYKDGEMRGVKVEALIPVDIQKKHLQYRKDFMKKPKPRSMGLGRDLNGVRKDGSTFPLEVSLSHMVSNGEQLVVAFIIDISIRKKNEEMLKVQRIKLEEYTNELERKVKNRTSELEHMNLGLQSQIQERKLAEDALRRSLEDLKNAEKEILHTLEKEKELGELKSRFVSMASHEFRTPLTTIKSSANLISKYTESHQQESREKHVNRIKKSVENLTGILNDFLSIEKLESGLEQLELSKVHLDVLVADVVEEMSTAIKQGQKVKFEIDPIQLLSDGHIIRNILINLISNAGKYSGANDIICITSEKTDKEVIIAVQDNGIGIPKDEQKNMFERFFRAKNVTNIKGTGLGLNIVKKYLELLNGTISFESEEGMGSTFKIHLPLDSK